MGYAKKMNDVVSHSKMPPRPPFRDGRGEGMQLVINALERQAKNLSWLAREIGMSRQAVSAWDEVPPRQILSVATATGLAPRDLRPDLLMYPKPEQPSPASKRKSKKKKKAA